jgi:SAM-dependent methyltransferase
MQHEEDGVLTEPERDRRDRRRERLTVNGRDLTREDPAAEQREVDHERDGQSERDREGLAEPCELVERGGQPEHEAEAERRRRCVAAEVGRETAIEGRAHARQYGPPSVESSAAVEAGGNVYDKYGTRNPIERRLVAGFIGDLMELVERTGAGDAHEVGCGEGELTMRLARSGLRARGSDVSAEVIADAGRRAADAGLSVPFKAAGIGELEPPEDAAELVVCCEVLEHVEDPRAALETLVSLARPWLIVSVPREPLWRALNLARLSYVGALGNTPGHLNHWSKQAFLRFLSGRLDLVETRSPLPWTMALCRASSSP